MLKYNTMRFLTDEFNPYIRQALLVSSVPINLTNFTRLDQFTVQGQEPEGSKRRFMFKIDDKIYKFSGQNLVEYTGTVSSDNVLSSGNTAAQVEAVKNNTELAGKKIYPIIALYTEGQDTPTARIVAQASVSQETLDFQDEHSNMTFYNEPFDESRVVGKILGFDWDVDITGDASAGFKVKLLPEVGGEWTDYLTLTEALGRTAVAVKPKYYYHVDAVDGTNKVKIKYFYVYWSPDIDAKTFGEDAYIISEIKNFTLPLTSCVLVVRYESLDGGSISAAVNFQRVRQTVYSESLPYNSAGTYQTAHPFIPSTIKIYVNGTVTKNFTFESDCQTLHITDSLSSSDTITCDYRYNHEDEVWLDMTADDAEPTDNSLYTKRFYLKNPGSAKKLGGIKIKLSRGVATVTYKRTATGEEQRIKFAHYPDSITCAADDDSEVWDFDYDTNNIVFSATAGQTVNISYTWHGDTPVIRGYSAAFTV